MTVLCAIDPGRTTGYAVFRASRLVDAGYVHDRSKDRLCDNLKSFRKKLSGDVMVIEYPRVYAPEKSKGDPKSLIMLSLYVGATAARFADAGWTVRLVAPNEWKGSRPKNVDHLHSQKILSEAEWDLFEAFSFPITVEHNVLDAIGIGLWALDRR
jgi:hypothetical protein